MAKTEVKVKLIGEDGNIFNLIGKTSKELKRNGYSDLATELRTKLWDCKSYNEALLLIMEYVEVK
jgi:hypothetical protein